MADYHILTSDIYGNRFTVVFHVPVPDVANEAGVNYRIAIVEWQGGELEIASRVPNIDPAELVQLQAGELYEVTKPYNSNPSETPAQKQAELDAMWLDIRDEAQDRLQAVLSYWGFERTIP